MSRRLTIAVVSGVVLGCGLGTAWAAFSGTTQNGANNFSVVAGDTTPPTITRATVAKTAGGSAAGTVRQGADYYVYAEVSDAVGVNTVTTNTSSFDTGITAQGLATAGGPWTVSGLSYNYRSTGTLTANTGLTTGSTPAYTITATDVATNQAGPTSFNATIEAYNSVVTGTSGLVSFWRFNDGVITADDLDDTDNLTLASHTGEVGGTWTSFSGQSQTGVFTNENRIRKSTGNNSAMYYTSGVPSSANYLVEADVNVKSIIATDAIAVIGRVDTGEPNMTNYMVRYDVATADWELRKHVAGTATLLGSYPQTLTVGNTYRMTLEMNGSTIRMYIDGVQRASVTDTAVTATGRGGIRFGTGSSTAQPTDTTGLHMDDFRVTSLTTTTDDGPGTNNGTYTNGPRLNQPGALAGDTNRAAQFDGVNDYVVVPDAASLDLGDGPLTLEAWVKRSTVNTNGLSIFQKGASAVQFGFYLDRTFLAKDNIGTVTSSTTTVTDTTTWHHVVTTKTGSAAKLYIDGVDRTGTVTNQTLINTTAALYIASKGGTAEFLPAQLDELAIYNQVLSAATVLDHYKAGAGTG